MTDGDKIITLSAIGQDAPGLVWKITDKVAQLGGNIIDVEEHCRRGLFAIYLEIDFGQSSLATTEILDQLRGLEEKTGLKIILKDTSQRELPGLPEIERYVITVLGIDKPGIMAGISRYLASKNINIEHCRMIARGDFFSMEMIVDVSGLLHMTKDTDPIAQMKTELKEICADLGQSVVIQEESAHKRMKKIIVFDVESALLEKESIPLFFDQLGGLLRSRGVILELKTEEKRKIETLTRNVQVLKGISLKQLQQLAGVLRLNSGAEELLSILKSMGFKIALLSSGLESILRRLFEGIEVDYAFANTLKLDAGGNITGELEEPILTDETKTQVLEFIMNLEHADPDQVIAVGDGSARSGFIRNAGLSIAYQPDEESVATDGVLKTDQISHVLYCLGLPMIELEKYMGKDSPDQKA